MEKIVGRPMWQDIDCENTWFKHHDITVQLTRNFSEPTIKNVKVIFVCSSGICIEWGKRERFIPWYHIEYVDRLKGEIRAA